MTPAERNLHSIVETWAGSFANPARTPGPGDEITWPACTNHPNDPRTPEDERDYDALADDEKVAYLLDEHSAEALANLVVEREARIAAVERELWWIRVKIETLAITAGYDIKRKT